MQPWQKILVLVDPTVTVHPEIEKAATLATRFGASLQLVICATKAMHEAGAEKPEAQQQRLQTLASPLRDRGLTVTIAIENAEVLHEGLLACARGANADLVVKQTHHHSLLQRTLFTNTDWHLIRDCPVPLLLTKEKSWHAAPTLLAGVDPYHMHDKPAALDHTILALATELARRLSGSVQVVHAYLPVAITVLMTEGMAPLAGAVTPEAMAQEVEAHRQRLRDLTQGYGIAESALQLVLGTPIECLPRMARQIPADIAVLGGIARRGLERLMIGSTAERVLERLPCDALIVKLPHTGG